MQLISYPFECHLQRVNNDSNAIRMNCEDKLSAGLRMKEPSVQLVIRFAGQGRGVHRIMTMASNSAEYAMHISRCSFMSFLINLLSYLRSMFANSCENAIEKRDETSTAYLNQIFAISDNHCQHPAMREICNDFVGLIRIGSLLVRVHFHRNVACGIML